MSSKGYSKRAETILSDEVKAVEEIYEKIYLEEMEGVIFFCSADYNLDKLAEAFDKKFSCHLIGCTTAGEIGSTYQEGGIVAVSLSSEVFRLHSHLMKPLKEFNGKTAKDLAGKITDELVFSEKLDSGKNVGFLLVDGLSVLEESVTANIYTVMEGVSLIGGSAGDSLEFKETKVYMDGKFWTDAGIFTLIETKLAFNTFQLQHFDPSEKDMVVTEADPSKRIVYEIDGSPASEAYADIIGFDIKELNPQVFAMYPLMLEIGDEWYIRSIQKINEDGSLTFFCAIDVGLPLTVAKGVGLVETLRLKADQINAQNSVEFTLGCDCILRRLEISEKNKTEEVGAELRKINFIGFSTYGEQFNSIHVNQTLTGIVFDNTLIV